MGHGRSLLPFLMCHSTAQAVGMLTCFLMEALQDLPRSFRIIGREGRKRVKVGLQRRGRGSGRGSAVTLGRSRRKVEQGGDLGQQFAERKGFAQTSGKAMSEQVLTLHVASGCDSHNGDASCTGNIGRAQQAQQVETVDGRHLHIGQQEVIVGRAQGIEQFVRRLVSLLTRKREQNRTASNST